MSDSLPPVDLRLAAWRSMSSLFMELGEALDEALWSKERLPLAWYEVLDSLHRHGGSMRMAQVADYRVISRSATTRLIEKLEEAGLVERRICPTDRRGIDVSLTDSGKERQQSAEAVVNGVVLERFGSHFSDEEARRLMESLAPASRASTALGS